MKQQHIRWIIAIAQGAIITIIIKTFTRNRWPFWREFILFLAILFVVCYVEGMFIYPKIFKDE